MKFIGAMAAMCTLVGCNSVSGIGSINGTTYHAVRTTDLVGPSAVTIIAVDENGNQTVASFGSDGILPAGIAAAGEVVAAEVYEGDRTNVSSNVRVKQNNNNRRPHPLSDRPPL